MIDVRSFGKVNTKLGHPGGDAALRLTADFLTHNLRENDAIVTRMGGDEFVLLLDLTPAAGEETRLTPGERLESVATRLMESYAEINSVMTYNEHVASRDEAIGLRIKSGVVIPTEENCDLLGFLRRIDPKGAIAEAYSENPEDYQVVTDPNEAFTNYIDQYIKRQTD
jgi:diguanylate cyclase (GGDEF)-like protein